MKQDWNHKKLTDLCAIQYGFAFDSSYFNDSGEGLPLIRIRDVVRGFSETYYSGVYPPEYIVKEGDYLIGMDGEFNIAQWKGDEALLNQRVCKIATKSDGYAERFAYYFLSRILKEIEDETPFVTVKHLSAKRLNQILTPVPSIEEQKAICSLLDKMNRVIEAKKEQLKELDNLAQAIFYDMFGDPVTNDKGWGVKKLDDVAFVKIGPFGSLLHKNDYIKGGVPLVNPIHMKDGRIYPDDSFTISIDKKKEMSAYLLKKGDVIFARRGEIGRCAIVSEKEDGFLCGTGSLFVRFTEPISEVFVLYWAKSESFVKDLVSKAKGATMLNINCNIVGNLLLPIPPLELQKKFSEKVKAIERQKELINQSIKDVQTLFDAKMDYYFGD